MTAGNDDLLAAASALLPELVGIRRTLHERPEVGLHLPTTQGTVIDALSELDLEVTTGDRLSSVVAVLRGDHPGPTVLLRADMDALPLDECSDEPFASRVPGAMHACGHDLHTAGLIGAARLLAARRSHLAGDVVLMFQPGEEFDDGASLMIEEGVLAASGRMPSAAYALHAATALPPGTFATRPGALLASADAIDVVVRGAGGHGGSPAETRDPVPALASLVLGFQALVARTRPVEDPVVLSVGRLDAGVARNVVPDTARLEGTLRSFSTSAREETITAVVRLAEHTALGLGVTAEVSVTPGYQATINDPGATERLLAVARGLVGPERVQVLAGPSGGSEDFSRVLHRVAGCMVMVGTAYDEYDVAPLHSASARFDDQWLSDSSALLASLAMDHLSTA